MIYPGDTVQPGALGANYGVQPYTVVPGTTPAASTGASAIGSPMLDPTSLAAGGANPLGASDAVPSSGLFQSSAPAVTSPTLTAPTITGPSVTAPSLTSPSLTSPSLASPTFTSPGSAMPTGYAPDGGNLAGMTGSPVSANGLTSGIPTSGTAAGDMLPSAPDLTTLPESYGVAPVNSYASTSYIPTGQVSYPGPAPAFGSAPSSFSTPGYGSFAPTSPNTVPTSAVLPSGADEDTESLRAVMTILKGPSSS